MDEAEQHRWTADKLVIPVASIVLQDVYFIKTHSEDYTAEGGINLKVETFCLLDKCHDHESVSICRNITPWQSASPQNSSHANRAKYEHCFLELR